MIKDRLVVSASEAAVLLKTNKADVLKLIDDGDVVAYRKGNSWRIPVEMLQCYVEEKALRETALRRKIRKEKEDEHSKA